MEVEAPDVHTEFKTQQHTRHGLEYVVLFCQMLFNSPIFLYVSVLEFAELLFCNNAFIF